MKFDVIILIMSISESTNNELDLASSRSDLAELMRYLLMFFFMEQI